MSVIGVQAASAIDLNGFTEQTIQCPCCEEIETRLVFNATGETAPAAGEAQVAKAAQVDDEAAKDGTAEAAPPDNSEHDSENDPDPQMVAFSSREPAPASLENAPAPPEPVTPEPATSVGSARTEEEPPQRAAPPRVEHSALATRVEANPVSAYIKRWRPAPKFVSVRSAARDHAIPAVPADKRPQSRFESEK